MVQTCRQTKKWRMKQMQRVLERRQRKQKRRVIRSFVSGKVRKLQKKTICSAIAS